MMRMAYAAVGGSQDATLLVSLAGPRFPVSPGGFLLQFLPLSRDQTRPEGEMPERLADYQFGVRREVPFHRDPLVRYTVVGALVYLTGPEQAEEWGMAPPGWTT
jgi:hypothetical protein